MQEEKHKASSGSQNHGVWVCNKCGWTYSNPHPSAKHRRNHKKHCGKLGDSENTGFRESEHLSLPDSDADLPVEEHGSPAKQGYDALEIEAPEKYLRESVAVENAGTEVEEASTRFEEEVFADAVTEFAEFVPSPRGGLIQVVDSDRSDADSGSGEGSLVHGHEPLAVGTAIDATTGVGETEQKPVNFSDSAELSRPQTSLHESMQTERHEQFVGFIGNPMHGHIANISGIRNDGTTCILELELFKNEAFGSVDTDVSVDTLNMNVQDNVEIQDRQTLEVEVELCQGKILSSDHAVRITKYALEDKDQNSSFLSMSDAREVQTGLSPDGDLKVRSIEICENEKECKKSVIKMDRYQEYESKIDVNENPICHLGGPVELEASLQDNIVHAEMSISEACSDTTIQSISLVMQMPSKGLPCSPTTRSMTIESGEMDPFSQVTQVPGTSVSMESKADKTGSENGRGDEANGYEYHGSKDEDPPSPAVPINESLGSFIGISIEIREVLGSVKEVLSFPTSSIGSEATAECNTNISSRNHGNVDKDVPHPTLLTTVNPGYILEASDIHGVLSLVKQKESLIFLGTEAPAQMDDCPEAAVPYSNGTHNTSNFPLEEDKDLIPEQELENGDTNDKCGSTILHVQTSSMDSDAAVQNESIFIENEIHAEYEEESSPLATLPEDQLPLDSHVQVKLHMDSRSNQNCQDEMLSQVDMEVSGMVLHIFNNENLSSALNSESCGPSTVLNLEDSNRSHVTKELVEVSSPGILKVQLVQAEEKIVASSEDLKSTMMEDSDMLTTISQTNSMEGFGVSVSEQANSSAGDDNVHTLAHSGQSEQEGNKDECSCGDNFEPYENGSDADTFEPPSFMIVVEPSSDYTETTNPFNSTSEQVAEDTNATVSGAACFPSQSSLVNESEGRKNHDPIDKAMSLEKARTPLKSLLVESMEENTDSDGCKEASMNYPKSPSVTTETKSESKAKTAELPSYNVYQSQVKGNPTPIYAAKIRLNSPAWILGNKREKQKNRGIYSWIACACCSSMN